MSDSDFYEEDEPVDDVVAAYERGEKGRTRRPRLDSVHSIRFSPEQVDRIRAFIGDESISAFIRRVTMDAVTPPVPVRTYACRHLSISGAFNDSPRCGSGCVMMVQPTSRTAGTTTLTMFNTGSYAA